MRSAHNPVVVATAADESYAMPLAVTLRSAFDRLGRDSTLRLFILDGGMSARSRDRLTSMCLEEARVTMQWIEPDLDAVACLPVGQHLSVSAYLRLLLPELLPDDVGKLIYLDSDMLVQRDLADLFAIPLGGSPVMAVQEMAAPWIDCQQVYRDIAYRRKFLSSLCPIANYRELRIRPDAAYFNTGLLLFDVSQWREMQVTEKALACLKANRQHVLWCDQYALNALFADQWQPLDQRWNQTAGVYEYPGWRESPLDRNEFRNLRNDPWIVHFCSGNKPWHYFCDHPYRRQFREVLRRTPWFDWRPTRPDQLTYQHWRQFRLRFRKSFRFAAANTRTVLGSGRRKKAS